MVQPWSSRSSECRRRRRRRPPHVCATFREVRNLACFFYVCRCSTPLADWDLPEDKPDFNTRTNDKLVQNGANQTLSAAGVHGAAPDCLLCA